MSHFSSSASSASSTANSNNNQSIFPIPFAAAADIFQDDSDDPMQEIPISSPIPQNSQLLSSCCNNLEDDDQMVPDILPHLNVPAPTTVPATPFVDEQIVPNVSHLMAATLNENQENCPRDYYRRHEIPSDYVGVNNIDYSDVEAWRYQVFRAHHSSDNMDEENEYANDDDDDNESYMSYDPTADNSHSDLEDPEDVQDDLDSIIPNNIDHNSRAVPDPSNDSYNPHMDYVDEDAEELPILYPEDLDDHQSVPDIPDYILRGYTR